jgi:peptidoglycan-associated lipoprotein
MSQRRNLLSALLTILSAAIVGCSSTPLVDPAAGAVSGARTSAPGAATSAASGSGTGSSSGASAQSAIETITLHPLDDPQSPLTRRSIYFEFDSVVVPDAGLSLLGPHARYLAANRNATVRIEGHTDERGGREYNLALGQRRAEAVLKALQLLGAPTSSLEAISFGKEKPADTGHDEAAWVRNRRADLHYLSR